MKPHYVNQPGSRPPTSRLAFSLTLWAMVLAGSLQGSHSNAAAAAEMITTPGITEPILDATLGTPVAGIIAARNCKEGEFVKKGQVIVELDKRLEELEMARRAVVLDPLKADFEANRTLYEEPKSSVSKEVLDKKESDYRVAVAEYELAKEQVRKRLITAPFDGEVTEIFLQVGEACQIQQPIVRLVDTRHCYFVGQVDAKAGHALQVGQKVNLEIEAGLSVALLEGVVSYVAPVVDPASGLMKVKVIFENPDGKIRPGVAGKMSFQENTNASARR
jgi:RND family efflux transporter MFP subunit